MNEKELNEENKKNKTQHTVIERVNDSVIAVPFIGFDDPFYEPFDK